MMPFAIQVAQFQLVILAQFKLVTYTWDWTNTRRAPGLAGIIISLCACWAGLSC